MNIRDFGGALIETRDLDPVYCCLYGAALSEPQRCRWLTAYMMFYHVGVASHLSEYEGDKFWERTEMAAQNIRGKWPRATERRHFRGQKCIDAVRVMREKEPEYYIRSLGKYTYPGSIIRAVSLWPLHGPWAGFKLADILERCMGYDITFGPDAALMYKEPRSALDILATIDPEFNAGQHYKLLLNWAEHYEAPPVFERKCGPQEVETILCKWKSHVGGGYHVGKDIKEVRHALLDWGETARKLLDNAPEIPGE